MTIDVQAASLDFQTPCLVVPVWQGEELAGIAAELNRKLNGLVAEIVAEDGFKGAAGETRVLYCNGAIAASRVILAGLGKREKVSPASLRKAAAKAARGVRAIKRTSFAFIVPAIEAIEAARVGECLIEGAILGLHLFNDFKTDPEMKAQPQIESISLLGDDAQNLRRGAEIGQWASEANTRAREWVNLPSNLKSPQLLAEIATRIAADNGLRCEVWDEKRIVEERMMALHGVGMGSDNPPRFIILEHAPAGSENDAPLVLVGKGMTFDTGGYSIKPATGMEDMKDDMGGAAAVLGAMSALQFLQPQKRIIALVASAENMINGRAQRPGDIVTARNGKTIEVLNTDAEGRLILADALSYACELKPTAIIDLATLTGAIGVALGQEAAGLFSNDDALCDKVQAAGETSGERAWRFPLWDEYRDHVKGTVSDVKNIGTERRAGSIAAAVFLEHFVADGIPWAHLDIASVAFIREDRPLVKRGATGFGVRLLLDFLKDY